uniref:Uncharacterized protein n=1 Tax=Anguilla anguilla TaxID=7936 RepID=A0A0E9RJD2_ANGAN
MYYMFFWLASLKIIQVLPEFQFS